jgi:hypothetical protein
VWPWSSVHLDDITRPVFLTAAIHGNRTRGAEVANENTYVCRSGRLKPPQCAARVPSTASSV